MAAGCPPIRQDEPAIASMGVELFATAREWTRA